MNIFIFVFYWLEYLNKLLDIMTKYATSTAVQLHMLDVYYCVCVLSAFFISMSKRLVRENHHKNYIVKHRPVTVCFKHSTYSTTKNIYQCNLHACTCNQKAMLETVHLPILQNVRLSKRMYKYIYYV